MIWISNRNSRARAIVIQAAIISAWCTSAGCENVEWNWRLHWWEKPRRVVPPDRSRGSTSRPRSTAEPASGDAVSATNAANQVDESVVSAEMNRDAVEPFFHLYLVSSEHDETHQRGERHIHLTKVDALTCARLLEPLYVPLGRSGSPQESYLIYQEKDEFELASKMAQELDVRPELDSGDMPQHPFQFAIAGFLYLLRQGAVVDQAAISECERRLANAFDAPGATPLQRWAVSILAARVAAEHRFDSKAARQYLMRAKDAAREESIERMIADWWWADALAQEGKTELANEAYRNLLDTYEEHWPGSHVVVRARAVIRRHARN